jgi:hypothetical protein
MSPYRIAIDRTTQTIDHRAKCYRNLIVAVVLVFLGSIVFAIAIPSIKPLAALVLILPICGTFFLLDSRLVARWRFELLDSWKKRDIDLVNFCSTITSIPTLPEGTIAGMLATLPVENDVGEERGISAGTRVAVGDALTTIHACRTDRIAFKLMVVGAISVGAILAAGASTWWPLLFSMGLLPTVMGFRLVRKYRLRQLAIRLSRNQRSDFQLEIFLAQIDRLNWEPISDLEKNTFLQRMDRDGGGKVEQQQSQGWTGVNVFGKSSTESAHGDSSGCT